MTLLDGIYSGTPLDTAEISRSELNIENKSRSNPLRWNGQFSPQLVQVLLKNYGTPESLLFDPFLGSGTVLLEAGLMGIAASGTEINPAAIALAQTYRFINYRISERRIHLQKVFAHLLKLFPNYEWGSNQNYKPEEIKTKLMDLSLSLHECLQYQLLETLIVLLDFYKSDLSSGKVFSIWKRLKKLVLELPYSSKPIEIYHCDARKTPLPDSSIDLVITSPPYINVFNYHQQYRASMEALSWDLLKVARSEFGSNRKHRSNRFLTVVQFCLDMAQTFNELARISCANGRLIFVVGRESKVRGTTFFNGEIVAEIAHQVLGFDLILRQERVFLNRFGQNIFEDILHFSPPTTYTLPEAFLESARGIAKEVLRAAYLVVPNKSTGDLKSAIEKVSKVKFSPIFNLAKVLEN